MMKFAALSMALLMGGAAFAQTATTNDTPTDDSAYGATTQSTMETPASVENPYTTESEAELNESAQTTTSWDQTIASDQSMAASDQTSATDQSMASSDQTSATGQTTLAMAPASPAVVQPGNEDPEHDARGIAVISDPAHVPDGWNGLAGSAMGGPLLDPVTAEPVEAADSDYPACSATVTDNCLQSYERGRA